MNDLEPTAKLRIVMLKTVKAVGAVGDDLSDRLLVEGLKVGRGKFLKEKLFSS